MIDTLLRRLEDWQKHLTEQRARQRIANAERHLQSALAEMNGIEPWYKGFQAKVCVSIRATLVDVARYKHARGMIEAGEILKAARGNQV